MIGIFTYLQLTTSFRWWTGYVIHSTTYRIWCKLIVCWSMLLYPRNDTYTYLRHRAEMVPPALLYLIHRYLLQPDFWTNHHEARDITYNELCISGSKTARVLKRTVHHMTPSHSCWLGYGLATSTFGRQSHRVLWTDFTNTLLQEDVTDVAMCSHLSIGSPSIGKGTLGEIPV